MLWGSGCTTAEVGFQDDWEVPDQKWKSQGEVRHKCCYLLAWVIDIAIALEGMRCLPIHFERLTDTSQDKTCRTSSECSAPHASLHWGPAEELKIDACCNSRNLAARSMRANRTLESPRVAESWAKR